MQQSTNIPQFLQKETSIRRPFDPYPWPEENNPVAALSEMMDMIDASPKTVVAALNGPALGGGGDSRMLELEELEEHLFQPKLGGFSWSEYVDLLGFTRIY